MANSKNLEYNESYVAGNEIKNRCPSTQATNLIGCLMGEKNSRRFLMRIIDANEMDLSELETGYHRFLCDVFHHPKFTLVFRSVEELIYAIQEGSLPVFFTADLQEGIREILHDTLTEREVEILKKLYGFNDDPRSLAMVGRAFGLSKERVRQVKLTALAKLRRLFKGKKLAEIPVSWADLLKKQPIKEETKESFLGIRIDELDISVRTFNCLEAMGIETIRDLLGKTEQQLLKHRNFGHKSLNKLKGVLAEMGLVFGMMLEE